MTEEDLSVPQDVAEAEPVAEPDQKASDAGGEQAAKDQTAEQHAVEETGEQKLEKALAKASALEKRIHRQNAKIADMARAADARRLQEQEPRQDGQPRDNPRPSDDDVERRANALNEQREYQRKLETWDGAGRKEFPDFVDRCNTVAGLGASDRPEFMQIVTDMDDGHKLVAHLADNPDEALRILSLPTHRMALELGKISAKGFAPKPPPQSAAPPPIKPLAGSGRSETDPEKMSMAEWIKWRDKQTDS